MQYLSRQIWKRIWKIKVDMGGQNDVCTDDRLSFFEGPYPMVKTCRNFLKILFNVSYQISLHGLVVKVYVSNYLYWMTLSNPYDRYK